MERLNREKKIEHSNIRVKVGTTNNDNPKAIYFEMGFFVSPNYAYDSYARDLSVIKSGINKNIRKFISNSGLFDERHISNFELSLKGLSVGKRSYASLQVTMRQKSDPPKPLKDIVASIDQEMKDLCFGIVDSFNDHDFSVYKTKV